MRERRDSEAMPVFLEMADISCCNKFNLAFVRNLLAMSSYFPFSLKANFLLFLSDGFNLFFLIFIQLAFFFNLIEKNLLTLILSQKKTPT